MTTTPTASNSSTSGNHSSGAAIAGSASAVAIVKFVSDVKMKYSSPSPNTSATAPNASTIPRLSQRTRLSAAVRSTRRSPKARTMVEMVHTRNADSTISSSTAAAPNTASTRGFNWFTSASSGSVIASGGTKAGGSSPARQLLSGVACGLARKSVMMPLTQSFWKATPWAAVGSTRLVKLLSPAVAASAKAGGVIGSKRPDSSSVGMSLTTGSSTDAGSAVTCQRAHVSITLRNSSVVVAAMSGRKPLSGTAATSMSASSAQMTE